MNSHEPRTRALCLAFPRGAFLLGTLRPGAFRLGFPRGTFRLRFPGGTYLLGAFLLGASLPDADAADAANPVVEVRSLAPAGVAPEHLSGTGLYTDATARAIAPSNRPYTPQYPLWSDGATKRRWVHLPEGTSIDASNPDGWSFPVGTKFWKEFAIGSTLETRYMERREEGWLFAAYVWNADGTDAVLAPTRGTTVGPWEIPGYYDCLACHEGRPERVLGFTALQLSTDRDPLRRTPRRLPRDPSTSPI
ncbi:MAG: hypothetical protein R3E97_01600 [Candidatus Eisenbacteria bacterium]